MAKRFIDAVLFDFGGVFTESPFKAATDLAARLGTDPERLLEIVFGPYDRDTDHPWHRLERGEVSLEAARDEIIALGAREGIESDPYQVLSGLSTGGRMRDDVVTFVHRLRDEGYKTCVVTNNAHEFRDAWRAIVPVDALFDAVVDSSEIGIRKPDARIYRAALRALGDIPPARAVFLDDHPGNVKGAVVVGIHGILVGADPREAIAQVEVLLQGKQIVSRGEPAPVRRAHASEAALLTALAVRSKAHWGYPAAVMQVFESELEMTEEELRDWFTGVIEVGGEVVGFYALAALDDSEVELERLFVEPHAIGRGYGNRLFADAIETARRHGYRRMVIMSEPNAEDFYRGFGAVRVEEVPSSIPGRSLPMMHLDLGRPQR